MFHKDRIVFAAVAVFFLLLVVVAVLFFTVPEHTEFCDWGKRNFEENEIHYKMVPIIFVGVISIVAVFAFLIFIAAIF